LICALLAHHGARLAILLASPSVGIFTLLFSTVANLQIESSLENFNPHVHSAKDRIDISPEFSFGHMLEFSKFAVAFAVELAGSN